MARRTEQSPACRPGEWRRNRGVGDANPSADALGLSVTGICLAKLRACIRKIFAIANRAIRFREAQQRIASAWHIRPALDYVLQIDDRRVVRLAAQVKQARLIILRRKPVLELRDLAARLVGVLGCRVESEQRVVRSERRFTVRRVESRLAP